MASAGWNWVHGADSALMEFTCNWDTIVLIISSLATRIDEMPVNPVQAIQLARLEPGATSEN
jgi:hypothetical protein